MSAAADRGLQPAAPDGGAGADVVVRSAGDADLLAVAGIERESFGDPWSLDAFRSALRQGGSFVVAERAGEVLGYAIAWSMVDEAELANIAVAPVARGQGIGTRLLDAAIAYAAGKGCTAMYLEVRESNARARALYASRGFEEVGRRRRYYRQPVEDALILRAALGRARR
jgi:[ribosomal protein S18]-alanine N-acetyltransferase